MRVVSIDEMKQIESITFGQSYISESLIIENVGIKAADFIIQNFLEELGELESETFFVLVGQGNNGADGLSLARHLHNSGYDVLAILLSPEDKYSVELKKQFEMALKFQIPLVTINSPEELLEQFETVSGVRIVVDAIFGTGFRLPLSNFMSEIISTANFYADFMIALDISSGITGDIGEMSEVAIEADHTLGIALPKTGYFIGEGARHSGEISVLDVGFPPQLFEGGDKFLLNSETSPAFSLERDEFAHKNSLGHLLIIGGSDGMTGAIAMAAKSALKTGVGLVTALTWNDSYHELIAKIDLEVMTGVLNDFEIDYDKYSAVVIGPGFGITDSAKNILNEFLLKFKGPMVIDADAINILSDGDNFRFLSDRKYPAILTPHVGEFSKLAGIDKKEVLRNPIELLKKEVLRVNCPILLKGFCSYLGLENGDTYINYSPNSGMATAGSGDVLAGIIGGLVAAADDIADCFLQGQVIHTMAGKLARQTYGPRSMTATSIIDSIPNVMSKHDD